MQPCTVFVLSSAARAFVQVDLRRDRQCQHLANIGFGQIGCNKVAADACTDLPVGLWCTIYVPGHAWSLLHGHAWVLTLESWDQNPVWSRASANLRAGFSQKRFHHGLGLRLEIMSGWKNLTAKGCTLHSDMQSPALQNQ